MYEEAGHEEECRREHVTRALLHMDQDMSEKVAQQVGGCQGVGTVLGRWQRHLLDFIQMMVLSYSARLASHAAQARCQPIPTWSPSAPCPSLLPGPQTAAAIFGELEELSVKAVMHKLSRGVVRRGRSSSAKGSVVGAAAGLKTKPRKGAKGVDCGAGG